MFSDGFCADCGEWHVVYSLFSGGGKLETWQEYLVSRLGSTWIFSAPPGSSKGVTSTDETTVSFHILSNALFTNHPVTNTELIGPSHLPYIKQQ